MKVFNPLAWLFDSTGFSYDRKNVRWISGRGNGHEDRLTSQYERDTQSLNARDLMRNYPIGHGIVNCVASSVIGSGIRLSVQSEDLELNAEIEARWKEWCYRPERTKTKSMKAVQRLCMKHFVIDGGIAVKLLSGGDIEVVELERFRSPSNSKTQLPYETRGDGSIKTWYIADRNDNGGFDEPKSVRADEVVTFFDYDRIDQLVPHSQLAACSKSLRDISETMDNAHRQVKDQTAMAWHHKRGTSGTKMPIGRGAQGASTADGLNDLAKASGMSIVDTDGDLKAIQSMAPGTQLEPFLRFSLQLVCMSIELPAAFVLKYFDSSYSASRSTLLQARAKILEWQDDFCNEFMTPIYIWKVAQMIESGIVTRPVDDSFLAIRWQLPAFEWIDQADATSTEIVEIKSGLRLMGDAAMKRGYQLEDFLRARAGELKMLKKVADEFGIDPKELSDIVIPGAPQTVIKEVQ